MSRKASFEEKSSKSTPKKDKISLSHSLEFLSSKYVKQCLMMEKPFTKQLKAYPIELLKVLITNSEGLVSDFQDRKSIHDRIFNMLLEKKFKYNSLTPAINLYNIIGDATSPELRSYHLAQINSEVKDYIEKYYNKPLDSLKITGGQPSMIELFSYDLEQLKILFKINQIAIGTASKDKDLLINKFLSIMSFLGIILENPEVEMKVPLLEEVDIFDAESRLTQRPRPIVNPSVQKEEEEQLPVVPTLNVFKKNSLLES
jgi:hypothetical protein